MPANLSSGDGRFQHAYFHRITIQGSIDQLIDELYINPSPQTVAHFKYVNSHLGVTVRPGRIAIVSPPGSLTCTLLESEMQAFALRVDRKLEAMQSREAEIAARYHELLSGIAGYTGAGYGIAMQYFNEHKKQIETLLKKVEDLYVKTYNSGGGLKQQGFLVQRRALFRQLDSILSKMLGRGLVGPDIEPGKIKRSLGISTKSILHRWKSQSGPVQDIPGYADNYLKIGRMAKTLKTAGYVGLTLDVAYSGSAIHQACTIDREDDQCARTGFREGGRLTGSIGGGALGGGIASYLVCNLVFGLPSGGTSALWCGIVVGAAGGYAGGRFSADYLANKAEIIYEHTKLK